jgi:hypothetical protein
VHLRGRWFDTTDELCLHYEHLKMILYSSTRYVHLLLVHTMCLHNTTPPCTALQRSTLYVPLLQRHLCYITIFLSERSPLLCACCCCRNLSRADVEDALDRVCKSDILRYETFI